MPAKKNDTNETAAVEEKTKAEKFTELATARTGRAIDGIKRLETLSNTANYEYTKEQTEKIVAALNAAVKSVEDRFNGVAKGTSGFSL